MAIDLSKLQAFAGGNYDEEEAPAAEPADTQQPARKGKKHALEETSEGGPDKFGQLLPLLEAHAEDIEATLDSINPEILDDLDMELAQEDTDELEASVNDLEPKLREAMKLAFSDGLSESEAHELGDHLSDEGLVADGDIIAAWLQRIANFV